MTKQRSLYAVTWVALMLTAACEQTLHTGKVGNTHNAPNPDGTCPAGQSVCGSGAFAQCLDLQNDRAHCGACTNACLPGIGCTAGVCQQVACTGPVTVSTQTVPANTGPTYFADINGDGIQDSVFLGPDQTFRVALGEAGGGFAAATTYQIPEGTLNPTRSIAVGDSNGDGFQDVYVLGVVGTPGWIELWLGHADGKLTLAWKMEIAGGYLAASVADLNGDGKLDLVVNLYNTNTNRPTVFLADANGEFHVGNGNPACFGWLTVVRDWNGDGFPDLVNLGNPDLLGNTLSVCLNKGNGTFDDGIYCGVATALGFYDWQPEQVTVVLDFNRDGHPDLAVARDSTVDILLGMGGCQFQPMVEYALTDTVQALVSGDVNGDGLPDLVAATKDGALSLLLGGPDGTFQVVPLSVGGTLDATFPALMVGDFTGDGKADVMLGGSTVGIMENTCP